MMGYTPASLELLATWHYRMKKAMAKANAVDHQLVAHRESLKALYKSQGMDKYLIFMRLSDDMDLRILSEDFKFHASEIQRFGAMIQAEYAMRSMCGQYEVPQPRESVESKGWE